MANAPAKKTKKAGPDLATQVAKWPIAAKAGLFAGTAVLIGGLFYMLFYEPYNEQRAGLESTIAKLKQDTAAEQKSQKNNQTVEHFAPAINLSYEFMQQYLPQENEMPRLVQMVSEIGARAGLSDGVTMFEPKLPAQVRDDYAEIPFKMKLEGEFLTVLTFLYDFSRMNRIVNITEVKIGSPKMVDPVRELFNVSVECSGSTYRSLTEAELLAKAEAAAAGKGGKKARKKG
jgi:type IV pilus assembly protein PilO